MTSLLSRRRLFKKGAAAAASATLISQGSTLFGQAPAVVTARTFRAWISRGTGRGRTTLQEVRLRPVTGRQVVVRTESCNLCYSNVGAVLGIQPAPPSGGAATPVNAGLTGANTNDMALIQGHGGVGVVEAVGPEVRRVQVGDRVCVSGTPQCGACYHCLRGRADVCQLLGRNLAGDLAPVADLPDGTPVYSNSHIGGLAELMITPEEWVVPVVTKASCRGPRHGPELRERGRTRRDHVRNTGRRRRRGHRCGRRMRTAWTQRRARGAHRWRIDDHRHRSDQSPPRAGDEDRRDARARSQRRRRQDHRARAQPLQWTDESSVERWTRLGRAAERCRRRFRRRGSGRRVRSAQARGQPGSVRHPADAAGVSNVQRRRPRRHDRARPRHHRAASFLVCDWRHHTLRRSGRRR